MMFDLKSLVKTAAIALPILFAAGNASASTITLYDLSGSDADVILVDTGVLTSAVSSHTFSSGMSLSVIVTPSELGSVSQLDTIGLSFGGTGSVGIRVAEDDFTAGAGSSGLQTFDFGITSTSISGSITARAGATSTNALSPVSAIGPDLFLDAAGGDSHSTATNLTGPFSIAAYFVITHTTAGVTSFDAIASVSAVPLPATGFLLIAALGGLGFAGRRKTPS